MAPRGKAAAAAGKGMTKVFPVGKLLRPAGGLRKGADIPARAGNKAARDAATKGKRVISQQEAWQRAAKARDDLHRKLAKEAREGPNGQRLNDKYAELKLRQNRVVTGATDPETGMSAGGHSFKAGGDWGCAEKNALDNLNKMRADRGLDPLEPHQVDFSKAERTSLNGPPSEEMPICRSWCQRQTNPEQYPDNVKYEGSAGPNESPWENTAGSRREHGRR
jgi:hypothetical protein